MLFFLLLLLTITISGCKALDPSYGVQDIYVDKFNLINKDKNFICLDGSKSIMGYKVNDDYCDCPDGSDEPGTSACTNLIKEGRSFMDWKFKCKNEGFKTQEIHHNRINDGICDCCDGSDEYSSNKKCPNNCAEVQEIEEKRLKEEERKRQAGIQEREKMFKRAILNRENDKKRLSEELPELEQANKHLEERITRLLPLEKTENEEKQRLGEKYKIAYEAWKQDKKINIKETTNSSISCNKWHSSGNCENKDEELNLNDKDCDEIIPSNEYGFCECFESESNSIIKHEKECDHEPLKCSDICIKNDQNNKDSIEESFDMDDGSSFELPEAKQLREEIQEFKNKINELNSSVENLKKHINRNITTEDVMETLKGECFSIDIKSYTYELCPFKDVHQYDKGTKSGPSMGRWGRFGESTYSLWASTNDYTHMIFEDGDRCWSGTLRSTDVHVVCGPENKLLQTEEPSMCRYSMVFQTPAVCE